MKLLSERLKDLQPQQVTVNDATTAAQTMGEVIIDPTPEWIVEQITTLQAGVLDLQNGQTAINDAIGLVSERMAVIVSVLDVVIDRQNMIISMLEGLCSNIQPDDTYRAEVGELEQEDII